MNTKSEIKTKRLILRHWQANDLPPFAELNADPRVMKFYPSILNCAQSDDLARTITSKLNLNNWGFWALELIAEKKFIGFVGLNNPHYDTEFTPCTEIGWRLAYTYWGQGYAQEAAKAALTYGFETLCLSNIVAFTALINKRSISLMQRLGMTKELNFDHPLIKQDARLRAHVLYRINSTRTLAN